MGLLNTKEFNNNYSYSLSQEDLAKIKDFLYCLLIWLCLIFIFLPILLLVFIPLYFWKIYIVPFIAKIVRPDLVKLLDGYDGILALDPFWTNPYSTLIGFITIEGTLDVQKFREKVLRTIFQTRTKDSNLVFEKMTQYPIPFLGYFFWKTISDISKLDNLFHINDYPVTEEDLKKFSSELIRKPFYKNGPLWDITIFTNYENNTTTAIQIRMNHIIADGMSCQNFFHKLCDYEQPPLVLRNNYKKPNLKDKLSVLFRAPAVVLHLYWDNLMNSDYFNRNKIKQEHLVSWTTFPSESLKAIRAKTNVHFSSIGLSLFGGFLSRHFSKELQNNDDGIDNDKHLRIMLPLPWPNHPTDKMVNHWTASWMKVPVSNKINAHQRLMQTNKDFWNVLFSGTPQFCRHQPPLLCFLPYHILKHILQNNFGMGLCFTSIPGMYTEDLNLLGHRVVSMISQCGPQFPQTGILASLFTYRGKVGFGITANKQLIPTQESLDRLITEFLQLELQEILKHCDIHTSSSSSSHDEFNNNCIMTTTMTTKKVN